MGHWSVKIVWSLFVVLPVLKCFAFTTSRSQDFIIAVAVAVFLLVRNYDLDLPTLLALWLLCYFHHFFRRGKQQHIPSCLFLVSHIFSRLDLQSTITDFS